ncbi:MAG: 30S ribosomal protein S6 [Polyangiaceae bacterium]|nr:30S ribosomal protein S6 [Polyangiaceae bacterium]
MAEAQILKSREYETIYILRSDVDADTADRVQARVAEVVARDSGKLVKVEAWGRRKLAYPIAKHKKGVYVYVKYVGRGGLVAEVERNLKLQDSVLKFQTVQTNDEVDVGAVTVDPEEIKFQRLELPVEEEKEESRERALGLIDVGDERRARREGDEDEFGEAGDSGADEGENDEPKENESESEDETP